MHLILIDLTFIYSITFLSIIPFALMCLCPSSAMIFFSKLEILKLGSLQITSNIYIYIYIYGAQKACY